MAHERNDLPPDHIVIVVFENRDLSEVMHGDGTDYFRYLTTQGLSFAKYQGITHPSQPNYLLLFSASNQGCTDDSYPPAGAPYSAPNLATSLLDNGLTFVGYAEDMPAVGSSTGTRTFYPRHCPWIPFSNVPSNLSRPFSMFPSDFSLLPTVSFVIPNMCDDAHSCPLSTANDWLRDNLSPYLAWAQEHNSLLVVTFDESNLDSSADTSIYTVILGDGVVRTNTSTCETVNHLSLQRWILELYSLPLYNSKLTSATPLPGYKNEPDTTGCSPYDFTVSSSDLLIIAVVFVALIVCSGLGSIAVCFISRMIEARQSKIEVIGEAETQRAEVDDDDQHASANELALEDL